MSAVLVLSARPDNRILTSVVLKEVLGDAYHTIPVTVLAEGWAVELPATDVNISVLMQRRDAARIPLDINIVPADHRKKKLLLADMDSTIITGECVDELADFAGVKDHVSRITERAMAGELDFTQALTERVALLKGLSAEHLQQAYDQRVHLTPGARVMTRTMAQNGATTALVSGGFTFFTARVKDAAGFDHHQSNQLELGNGRLTGAVIPPILDAEAKQTALSDFSTRLGLQPHETMAIGDGANDRFMVAEAGLGIAFHGKEVLKSQATATIDHGDLHTALVLQGYSEDDFIVD